MVRIRALGRAPGRTLGTAALLAAAILVLPPAAAHAMDAAERQAIEGVVRDYLLKNPEVILQAVEGLRAREKAEESARAKQALVENHDALYKNPNSPVGGNPKGDVTVVEFFDYQCGYCKAVHADVNRLVTDDGKLRLVYKEFPILGPGSLIGSKAALAARAQGKYIEMHNALMEHRGQIDDALVMRLARSLGLDADRLKADMDSDAVRTVIADNQRIAEQLGITGTPGFIFGEELVPGAIKLEQMKQLVSQARRKG